MTKQQKPRFKDGYCDDCGKFGSLWRFKKKYYCCDCFVGDYDEQYVQDRLAALTRKTGNLAAVQEK